MRSACCWWRSRSSSGVAARAATFVLGERSAKVLGELKSWMAANNAAIMAVITLVIGVKILGDGISGL